MKICGMKEEINIWFIVIPTGNATHIQVPDTAYKYL